MNLYLKYQFLFILISSNCKTSINLESVKTHIQNIKKFTINNINYILGGAAIIITGIIIYKSKKNKNIIQKDIETIDKNNLNENLFKVNKDKKIKKEEQDKKIKKEEQDKKIKKEEQDKKIKKEEQDKKIKKEEQDKKIKQEQQDKKVKQEEQDKKVKQEEQDKKVKKEEQDKKIKQEEQDKKVKKEEQDKKVKQEEQDKKVKQEEQDKKVKQEEQDKKIKKEEQDKKIKKEEQDKKIKQEEQDKKVKQEEQDKKVKQTIETKKKLKNLKGLIIDLKKEVEGFQEEEILKEIQIELQEIKKELKTTEILVEKLGLLELKKKIENKLLELEEIIRDKIKEIDEIKEIKKQIRYLGKEKIIMNNNDFNEFLFETKEESFEKCFKNFFNNKNLIEKFKSNILEFIKNKNIQDSELLIKKNQNDEICFVINSKKNPNGVVTSKEYSQSNVFYRIINNKAPVITYYENNSFMIIQDKNPYKKKLLNERSNLHLLLIPKKEYLDYIDFFQKASEEETVDFFKALYEIIKQYDLDNYLDTYKDYSCLYTHHNKGVFPGVRNGHSHQTVYHFHVHIHIPNVCNDKNFIGLKPIEVIN